MIYLQSGKRRVCWILSALFVAAALLLSSAPALGARAGSDPLERVEPFTEQDEETLADARISLEEARKRLLRAKLSDAQQTAVDQQIWDLMVRIQELEQHQRAWKAFESSGGGTDADKCIELFKKYEALQITMLSSQDAADLAEWNDLALQIAPFATLDKDATEMAPYAARARLVAGVCYLRMSEDLSSRLASRDEVIEPYIKGICLLDLVARGGGGGRLAEDVAMGVPDKHRPYVDVDSRPEAAELLNDFCPWGVPLFMMLYNEAYTTGMKHRILRPYGDEKLSEFELTRNIPSNVEEDLAAVVSGRFDYLGQPVKVNWVKPPKLTYSVWFYSPSAYDMSAATMTTWGLRVVKVLKSGPWDLIVDELLGFLVDVIGKQLGETSNIYATCSLVVDANNFGVIDSDFLLDNKPTGRFKFSKSYAVKWMEYFEKKEIEYLFDSIDPKNEDVWKQIGHPKSYDGKSPMPQVMIRADLVGFEKMPKHRYPRVWQVVHYYQLDPRPLLGGSGSYNLGGRTTRTALPKAPYEEAGRISDSVYWKRLPNSAEALLGQRLYITDFTPKGQIITVKVSARQIEKWAKEAQASGFAELSGRIMGRPSPGRGDRVLYDGGRLSQRDMSWTIINENNTLRGKLGVLFAGEGIKCPTRGDMMFSEYKFKVSGRTKIGQDDKGRAIYRYGKDVAEFDILMHNKPGRPVKGKISNPGPGVVKLVFNLDEPFELEPKGGDQALLPPAISVGIQNLAYGKKDEPPVAKGSTLSVTASVAPVEAGQHKLIASVGGKACYFHDATATMSSAGCFKGEIPLQVGLNKIVFSFDGAEDYVLEVKRNEPEDRSTDIAKARATAEEEFEASRWARQNKDLYRYYYNLFSAYGTCIDVAEDYVEIGLYDSARERLDYVLKGLPAEAAVKQDAADLGHLVDGEKADANKVLTEVAFFTHNPELLKKAALTWLPLAQKATIKNLPDVGAWYYEQQAGEYAKLIHRYIAIGGSPGGVSELLAKYAECRRKTGFYDPKYDLQDFKYPGGPGE